MTNAPLMAVTLRSGSSGNCTLISNGEQSVLVDCGISLRALTYELSAFGIPEISGIFLTHEHSDHTSMLSASRKLGVTVFGSGGTLGAVCAGVALPRTAVIEPSAPARLGSLTVRRFNTSHDAAESCGYVFESGGCRVGVCTDLGEMTDDIMDALGDCKYVVLESNHDVQMLSCGPYPLKLRRRILSRLGHLSNDDCARAIVGLTGRGVRRVTLAHLSEENNDPSVALGTAAWALSRAGMEMGRSVEVDVAPRKCAGSAFLSGHTHGCEAAF